MDQKQKKQMAVVPVRKTFTFRDPKIFWLAAALLLAGFIGGAIFGTMKTDSNISGKSPAPGNSSASLYQELEADTDRNPQNADAWTQLGNAYFDNDQYQKAIFAYEKSLSIEPENTNVITDLGTMYRLNKQPEKAVEMFNKTIALDPKHEIARMNKGIVLLHDLNDEQGAVRTWEELLEINPIAVFGNGQSVDEVVQHYKDRHEKSEQ
jgi:cytochrome c-type biogenesis protein CcmH/NrfG